MVMENNKKKTKNTIDLWNTSIEFTESLIVELVKQKKWISEVSLREMIKLNDIRWNEERCAIIFAPKDKTDKSPMIRMGTTSVIIDNLN